MRQRMDAHGFAFEGSGGAWRVYWLGELCLGWVLRDPEYDGSLSKMNYCRWRTDFDVPDEYNWNGRAEAALALKRQKASFILDWYETPAGAAARDAWRKAGNWV